MTDAPLSVTLVLTSSTGRVYVWNGCGYSDIGRYGTEGVLQKFDDFAAWVCAGNGRGDEDVSTAARATVVEACRLGRLELEAPTIEIGRDAVPLFGGRNG